VKGSLKRKLLGGLALSAVLAAVTMAAVTIADPAGHRRSSPLVTAASYLGVSTAQLKSELRSGKSLGEIANATSGRSSTGLIDTLLAAARARLAAAQANLPKRVAAQVNRPGGRHGPSVAAGYLGLTPAQLRAELRSGRTLAQIADATSGKSAAGLIDALVAARTAKLAARVAAGALTKSQQAARVAKLRRRVTAMVNKPHRSNPARQGRRARRTPKG
jgi:hypothetical protein